MNEVRCVKIKLRPDSLTRVREWAAMINARKPEALATLEAESIVVESFFLDSSEAGDYLIGYIRAGSLAQAAEVVKRSMHALDAYHQQFKKDTWEAGQALELLVDLNRLDM
jgi:hypothetical protein